MTCTDIICPITVADYQELEPEQRNLVDAARRATHRSYAPYSNFHVGAAILLDNGVTVEGSNQENAATPSSLCAERTAAYYAHSAYPDAHMAMIAIAARDSSGQELEEPISPCGACRQVLVGYESLAGCDVPVILVGRNRCYILPSARSLLPLAFTEF